jgi:hypothetical protein
MGRAFGRDALRLCKSHANFNSHDVTKPTADELLQLQCFLYVEYYLKLTTQTPVSTCNYTTRLE